MWKTSIICHKLESRYHVIKAEKVIKSQLALDPELVAKFLFDKRKVIKQPVSVKIRSFL